VDLDFIVSIAIILAFVGGIGLGGILAIRRPRRYEVSEKYPPADWRKAVADGETIKGYLDWVELQKAMDHDCCDCNEENCDEYGDGCGERAGEP
jgi:hypothetical protein